MKKLHKMSLFLAMALFSASLTGCSSTVKSAGESKPAAVSSKATTSSKAQSMSSQAAESVASEAEEESVLPLGTEGALKDWSVTATEMRITDSVSDSEYLGFSPKEGNLYLVVSTSVTNNGKKADSFLPAVTFGDAVTAKVYYGDGYEYSSTYLMAYSNELHDLHLNPLSTGEGEVTFELPTEIAESSEALIITFASGKDELSFKLR